MFDPDLLVPIVAIAGFWGTICFSIWAAKSGWRKRGQELHGEKGARDLLADHERQKQELVDTILQYDTRMEQLEKHVDRLQARVAELERGRFASAAEAGAEARIGRSDR